MTNLFKYNIQNVKGYFNLIQNLKNLNLTNDQNILINQKFKLINQEISELTKTLNYQITDNCNNQQNHVEELNHLDQKYPINDSSDYFDLLKNQNNLSLREKKHKIITQNIDQIENENKLLTNTINNCQKYISLTKSFSESNKKNIHQELKIFFNHYQNYFLLNFINQNIIRKSINSSEFKQSYNFYSLFIFKEILYLIIFIYPLILYIK